MLSFLKRIFYSKKTHIKKENFDFSTISFNEVFSIDNFNKWFNDPNNNATYAHSGIFLRTDKLSEGHFIEYFESYENIDDGNHFIDTIPNTFYTFKDSVRDNWYKKLQE